MKKTINYRSFLASAAVMLTFTALTAACDQEQSKVKTAQIAPAKAKEAPGLIPAQTAPKSMEESLSFLPDPVAIIGDKKISKAEFLKKMGNIPPEFLAQMPKNLLMQQFKMAIETMINEYLLLLSAEKAGIKPSKELAVSEFEKKLKTLPAAQLETLKQELAKQGKTLNDLKKEFTTNPEVIKMTAVNSWIERDLRGKLNVTDAEVTKYYNDNKATFKMPRTVTTSHILISGSDTPGTPADPAKDKAAREKAESILAQIKKGADFGTIAQKESKCGSAQAKGMLGELSQNQLVPEYFNAAFALKPGEISKVVKSPFGYHIIKLHSKKEATTLPLDAKMKTALKEKLTSDKLEKQIKTYIKAQKLAMKVIIPPFKGEEAAAKKAAPAAKKAAPAAKKAAPAAKKAK